MVRLIKRYGGGSRKLYDTEESRYVSLDELAALVRAGQELRVVDSASGEDVTGQVLAQVIYEGEKQGRRLLSPEVLHDVIRRGEAALLARVEQLQAGVDRLVKGSMDRLPPVRDLRGEYEALQQGLADLEASLAALEAERGGAARPKGRRKRARVG
ncbi:MAG TPA: polyhydroxyalkanoate synthesis regulator DNA-binding domain-containing protein [Gemmatimonadales bacterium]|nr:polyhydroxyalkanoate synthesis regulator DNA-binding domain-containing protein [Gemmatimonadales bacterium]